MTTWEVIDRVVHDTSGTFSHGDVTNQPCPAITVGINSVNSYHYQIHYHTTETPPLTA